MLERNKSPTIKHTWNLSGLLIGNGWIAPSEQYVAYLAYAYASGVIQGGSDAAKQLEAQQTICLNKLAESPANSHVDVPECEGILSDILRLSTKDNKCVNMYDVRLTDSYPSCGMAWPPDLVHMNPYLRKKEVTEALHVGPDKHAGWTECAGAVSDSFKARNSKPSIHLLPDLLTQVPIILFSGDKDLICNHLGTESLIHNMEWNGGTGFELSPGTWAPRRDWTFEGDPAGYYQEARNLTYILFYNSSHMVPFDYPRRTRDMLDRFLNVDIASIGGTPADSRIDGEKGIETSVGGHPNSTAAESAEKAKLEKTKLQAYYKSGEVALIVVIILAGIWGWWVWRGRRKEKGYLGLGGGSETNGFLGEGMGLGRRKRSDLEARDFDESELDDLGPRTGARYSLGDVSDDEGEPTRKEKEGTEGS